MKPNNLAVCNEYPLSCARGQLTTGHQISKNTPTKYASVVEFKLSADTMVRDVGCSTRLSETHCLLKWNGGVSTESLSRTLDGISADVSG